MHWHRNQYKHATKACARGKPRKGGEPRFRYIGLLAAGAIVAFAVMANAHAAEQESPGTPKETWTDHNTHDPGVKADPAKVREMLAELAEEEAARKMQLQRDDVVLQRMGVGLRSIPSTARSPSLP